MALLWVLLSAPAISRAATPVSPGSPETFARLGSSCPVFNWSLDGVQLHTRLVVVRVQATSESETPVLDVELPLGSTSWTPGLDQCFRPGRYGWHLRTPIDRNPVTMLFEVVAKETDLATAARSVRAYLDQGGSLAELFDRFAPPQTAVTAEPTGKGDEAPIRGQSVSRASEDGRIVSPVFAYTSPRALVHRVNAYEFLSPRETVWRRGFGSIWVDSPTNLGADLLQAPLNLPQGATITELTCYHWDKQTGEDATWTSHLFRRPLDSASSEAMASVINNSFGSFGVIVPVSETDISSPIVSNFEYSYFLTVFYVHDEGEAGYLPNLRFYGCTVGYELTELTSH